MFELLIPLPNILAQFACMVNQAFYANLIYCIGYPPFMWRNYKRGDRVQLYYFSFLWVMSICGVILYLTGWSIEDLIFI